ncbi:MAG: hypothetical protein CM1200mP34_1260 [Verrucomicrobiales bacterium]|nr:MAG: hypothetical protein CM1200mP34_1260 [Verrucomicrobiales bacterium]
MHRGRISGWTGPKHAQQVKRCRKLMRHSSPGERRCPGNGARGTFLEETLQYPLERLGGRHAEPRDTLRAENRVEAALCALYFC